jgi:alkylhydroperoxidase/carboxymuconolactone decarboxylase family protein YurZ
MLGTPKTAAFEKRVKTLVRAAWKAGKTDDEILSALRHAIQDPATPGKAMARALQRLEK